ncbi:AsmA-like C-terminal domain-containing protein [Magnetospira thiophila]
MIKKTLRGAIQILGGLGAGLTIVMILLAWRLSSGPIQLGFLTPYLEDALNGPHQALTLRLEDTVLTWAGWRRTLDIRLINARLMTADDQLVARAPELSLSLSGYALVKGVLAPRRIELFGPTLRVVRRPTGAWELDMGKAETSPEGIDLRALLADMQMAPDPLRPLSYLTRINIHDGHLSVIDQVRNLTWTAPQVDAAVQRDRQTLEANLEAHLSLGDMMARVEMNSTLNWAEESYASDLEIHDLPLNALAPMHEDLAPLEGQALPVAGTITVIGTFESGVEAMDFDLSAEGGVLQLPTPLSQHLELSAATLRGGYLRQEQRLTIAELVTEFPAGTQLILPPENHPAPLRALRGSGRIWLADGRVEIPGLSLDLDGPTLLLKGQAERLGTATHVTADAKLLDAPVDRWQEIWPAGLANDARDWCLNHLSGGRAAEGDVHLALKISDDGAVDVERVDGTLSAEAVDVDYLPPMPPVHNVWGTATFNGSRFDITLKPVREGKLTINRGTIGLFDLDTAVEKAEIDLDISGPAPAALALIDNEPFRFASALDLNPASVRGQSRTRVHLKFALAKDLRTEDVEVKAESDLTDVHMSKIVLDMDLSQGKLHLTADNKGMELRGEALMGSIPASLSWREHFSLPRPFIRRYHVQGTLSDSQRTDEIGLQFAPFTRDFMTGPAAAEVRYTVQDNHDSLLQARLDLRDMALSLSGLGWSKPPGRDGQAEAVLHLRDDQLIEVPSFHVRAGDLSIQGQAKFGPGETTLRSVQFDKFAYGHTNLSGLVVPRDGGGWDANFEGESFDMASLLDNLSNPHPEGETENRDLPPVTLSTTVEHLWLGEGRELTRIAGAMNFDGEKWRGIRMQGKVGGDQDITLVIKPEGEKRLLEVQSTDAGAALRAFDLYDRMVGGSLDLDGEFHDRFLDSPLSGTLNVSDFRLLKAPTIAKLVSYMSITGVLEALDGEEGLKFSTLELPFLYREGSIEVKDGKATGLSLGGTLSGKYNLREGLVDFSGTLVPAYALNAALGKIPVLGDLFTGGEKGSGVFAATYKVKGGIEDPEVNVNALSALAPGFLRNLFGVLDGATEEAKTPDDGLRPPKAN